VAFTNELAYQSIGRKWLGTQLPFKKLENAQGKP